MKILFMCISLFLLQGCMADLPIIKDINNAIEKSNEKKESEKFFTSSIEKIKTLEKNEANFKVVKDMVKESTEGFYRHKRNINNNKDGKALVKQFNDVSSQYIHDASVLILEAQLETIKKLPLEQSSMETIKSIGSNARYYDDFQTSLATEVERKADEKMAMIGYAIKYKSCTRKLPDTKLPKSIYKNKIWGIHAGAVQYRGSFESLFCNVVNKGNKVKFIPAKSGTTNYGMEVSNDITTSSFIFAKLPDEDAWILREVQGNGKTEYLTTKQSLELLIMLSQ